MIIITISENRNTPKIVGALILVAYAIIIALAFDSLLIIMLLEVISGVAVVAVAVLLLPVLRPHNNILSIGYFIFKTIEGIVMIIAGILLFALVINMEMHTLIYGVHDYIFGIAYLILSYLLYQSKLVRRFISIWGLIASILYLLASLLDILGIIPGIQSISLLPIVLNEILLAIWLIVKGFNEEASIKSE